VWIGCRILAGQTILPCKGAFSAIHLTRAKKRDIMAI